MASYPRETVELVPVVVTVDGVGVTSGVNLAVTPAYDGSRPEDWEPATELDGHIGYLLGDLTASEYPATFRIWADYPDDPEIPVIDCGTFRLT